ncbi:MAG TPA: choice-of-anchor R domain-containing protein [Rhizomicrobium sp.]|jgi:hypothetical protein
MGTVIFGPRGQPESWQAAAFTLAADQTATKVDIATSHVRGTEGVVVSLYSDTAGLPGTSVQAWNVSSLPTSGICCTVEIATDRGGIPLTGGTQYWIVVSTDVQESNTWAGAHLNAE